MGQLQQDRTIIYESPDGGETVYGRYVGETERFLVGKSVKKLQMEKELADTQLWYDIRKAAESNEALKRALEHCILLYQLSLK
ncbi:MAG: hypothetical protein EBU90_11525 [Proteobacteria bacterium]|nr:hypothetical protein [Pseudomonadota bacterium]NBP14609.1 hypothetical protein [bacterium]